jgi:predicted GNAT family acetyltransferase
MPDDTPSTSQITVRDNSDEDRFEALDPSGNLLAISTYRRYQDRIVFLHTEVDEDAEGQGVGSDLVRRALDQVREEGLRVVAQCPFVKEWIGRHPDYADLTS